MGEIAEIFRLHGPAYRATCGDRMLSSHLHAMQDIEACRPEALGGHIYSCEQCEETPYRDHSCKKRHGPKCQNDTAQRWLDKQRKFLLPVPHFLVTFPLPEALRELARSHQNIMYPILFRSSAAALQKLASDPRFIGGKIGMVGVLHTWTRDLRYHPHVHSIVPGGGLSPDGKAWLPSREEFLVHVKPLSLLFRAQFRDELQKTALFNLVPPETWEQDWVVHSEPVGRGGEALKYLAPYMFRVAISNNRLLTWEDGQVTFHYKESRTGTIKLCPVTAEEFMRRFLQHVLPDGFVKVRYDGFLSPSNRALLQKASELLGRAHLEQPVGGSRAHPNEHGEVVRCPTCGTIMVLLDTWHPQRRGPP